MSLIVAHLPPRLLLAAGKPKLPATDSCASSLTRSIRLKCYTREEEGEKEEKKEKKKEGETSLQLTASTQYLRRRDNVLLPEDARIVKKPSRRFPSSTANLS